MIKIIPKHKDDKLNAKLQNINVAITYASKVDNRFPRFMDRLLNPLVFIILPLYIILLYGTD